MENERAKRQSRVRVKNYMKLKQKSVAEWTVQ